MSLCVSVCACRWVFMSMSVSLISVCVHVHCDFSWQSGLGSELRPLVRKATSRTRIVPSP